ncbi:MAG TPA: flagellar protein FlbB [Alphaproteobacteria bacterium]|nr:flagellar protein FlbB [Micavibrio sp.]MBK9561624.1 flagellar protein FlbB [Micavibrio sp.]HQX26907.1 flagellar protein FlbB [Alphaproteobacteria bacterium]
MNLSYIKILPLLVFVAMLAFTVRFAEVAMDISRLSGSAVAADAPHAEPEKKEEPAAEAKREEEKRAAEGEHQTETAAKEGEAKEGEAKPLTAEDKPPAEDTPDWVDADDSDTEFSTVRTELYDNLGKRREELDKRESDMVAREALLRAAEQEIDRKYNELAQLRGEIEKLLQKQSDEEQARIVSLVKIYEGMKPSDAARIFDTLDIDVLMQVMSRMSERKLSPVMAAMNPERAKTMTIMLAEQKQLPSLPAN